VSRNVGWNATFNRYFIRLQETRHHGGTVVLVANGYIRAGVSGYTLLASIYGATGFWVGVFLIILRRPQAPATTDLIFIRIGSLPVIILAQFMVRWIWCMRVKEW